jgi:hypothetical protein
MREILWSPDLPPEDTAPPPIREVPLEQWTDRERGVAREMLRRQMCPVCGEGPWKSPLNHAAKKHGILKADLREACRLTMSESVCDPALAERFAENGRQQLTQYKNSSARMAALSNSRRSTKGRLTTAGREALTANLSAVTADQSRAALLKAQAPEAQAKRTATLREQWAAMTPEERRAKSHLPVRSSDEQRRTAVAGWDKRGRQGCGTVAAYKRGCRCEACREAKRRSRRTRVIPPGSTVSDQA